MMENKVYFKFAGIQIPKLFLVFATILWVGLFLEFIPRYIVLATIVLAPITLFSIVFKFLVLKDLRYSSADSELNSFGILLVALGALGISILSTLAFPLLTLWQFAINPTLHMFYSRVEEYYKTEEALRKGGEIDAAPHT